MSETITSTQEQANDVTLTNKDISQVTRRWIFSNTASWSYERMQNIGFAWSLAPALKKIYPKKGDLSSALTRHLAFFNTEMVIGSPILSVVLALEEERVSKGEGEVSDELIQSIKAGLMGPLAALGDSLFASTLNALLLSFCMSIAMEGNPVGSILYLVIWCAIVIGFSRWGIGYGYKQGMNIMDSSSVFSDANISKITAALAVVGLTVLGGLSAGFVTLSTPITWGVGESVTALQDIFDGLMPGLLPLAITLITWFLHDRKNMSVLKLLGVLIVIGAAGSLVGLFG